MNEYLKEQMDDFGNNMRPQKNNPGKLIQQNFSRELRINALKNFYDLNRFRYIDARYDFYKNNGIRWKP